MSQPILDDKLVQRLTRIAAQLDGGRESEDASLLDEFNRLAGTKIPFSEFQGISGGEDHIHYVRRVLIKRATQASPDLNRDKLIELFARIVADPCDNAYLSYAFALIEKTFGDDQISDLVFWPGEYFGDGNDERELTPELMADTVLERHARKKTSR